MDNEQKLKQRPKSVLKKIGQPITENKNKLSLNYENSVGVSNERELRKAQKLDLKLNKIDFEFPFGFTQINIIEDIRLVEVENTPENFDILYDIVMQKLSGKGVNIYIKDDAGIPHLVAAFVVTGRTMNLHGVDFLDKYPIVVGWMVSFIKEFESKKFPLSVEEWESQTAQKK